MQIPGHDPGCPLPCFFRVGTADAGPEEYDDDTTISSNLHTELSRHPWWAFRTSGVRDAVAETPWIVNPMWLAGNLGFTWPFPENGCLT